MRVSNHGNGNPHLNCDELRRKYMYAIDFFFDSSAVYMIIYYL